MQPSNYTIYLKNLAQTISRFRDGVDEVITGKDTLWAGGRLAANNYANQRYTIPQVRRELCQELASKQDTSFSLIERVLVKVTHTVMMPPTDAQG